MKNEIIIKPGSAAISNSMALELDSLYWYLSHPYSFAYTLLCFDALIQAFLFSDNIYAFSTIRAGKEEVPLFPDFPDLHCEIIFPEAYTDEHFPKSEMVDILLNDPGFSMLITGINKEGYKILHGRVTNGSDAALLDQKSYVKKYTRTDAEITVGDLWRSQRKGLSFFANQLETPICIYEQLIQNKKIEGVVINGKTARNCANTLQKLWRERAIEANELKGHNFFTINMPLYLLAVLRECKEPNDILKVLSQLRKLDEAIALRKWFYMMDSEANIDKFESEYFEFNSLVDKLSHKINTKNENTTLQIGLSPSVNISYSNAAKSISNLIFKRDIHLRFLKKIFRNAVHQGVLENELIRIFDINKHFATEVVSILDQIGNKQIV